MEAVTCCCRSGLLETDSDMATATSGKVLVYGGKGALGATVVNYFKSHNWVCIKT